MNTDFLLILGCVTVAAFMGFEASFFLRSKIVALTVNSDEMAKQGIPPLPSVFPTFPTVPTVDHLGALAESLGTLHKSHAEASQKQKVADEALKTYNSAALIHGGLVTEIIRKINDLYGLDPIAR